jgi:hypothetical protein
MAQRASDTGASTVKKMRGARKASRAVMAASRAVIRVGDGRGFVVRAWETIYVSEADRLHLKQPISITVDGVHKRIKRRPFVPRETCYIITAAHCLPSFPPCHGNSYLHERTYQDLLGPLGEKPTVWAECAFADPIADIAVLGPPDNQEIPQKYFAYEALLEKTVPLMVSDAPEAGRAWLLSLDGRWFPCDTSHRGRSFWLSNAAESIVGGMSGSPILADDGSAIGVLCLSSTIGSITGPSTEGGPNPRLITDLPGWLLRNLRSPRGRT